MACTGHALAAGALLLATGDERIGIRGPFKLGLNEVAVSMPVPILAHELARDRLDPRHLTRSVLQAHIYDPESACDAGWLDQVVDADRLMERARAEAERLGALPPHAYALTKKSLRSQTIEHIRSTMATNMLQITGS
jgi:enoyl-CoA hydratase